MRQILILTATLGMMISVNSSGQEIKRKRVVKEDYSEEYNVLKENKKVKHGQYLKFQHDILDRKVLVELGFFDQGNKEGAWYSFYPKGALKSYGTFEGGLREGQWIEYYNHMVSVEDPFTDMFDVQNSIVVDEDGRVTVEGMDRNISAAGLFEADHKTGAWEYYDHLGNLVHTYDHSSNTMLVPSELDSTDRSCPYLGGMNRFNMYCIELEKSAYTDIPSDAKVVLKLELKEGGIAIERISSTGDREAALRIEEIIRTIPNDWIPFYFTRPVQLTWVLNWDSNRALYTADFE